MKNMSLGVKNISEPPLAAPRPPEPPTSPFAWLSFTMQLFLAKVFFALPGPGRYILGLCSHIIMPDENRCALSFNIYARTPAPIVPLANVTVPCLSPTPP